MVVFAFGMLGIGIIFLVIVGIIFYRKINGYGDD